MSFLLSLLLGGWGFVRNALSALFGFIKADPKLAIIIALAVACVWLYHGRSTARDDAAKWQSAFVAQQKATVAASKAAEAHALEARAAAEAHSLEIAHAQDTKAALIDQLGRSNRDAYAAAHLVRPPQASPCVPGGTGQAAVPVSAQEPDGPGGAADMVAVSRADYDQLTDAALRAAENHDTADQWIANGIALPEPDPPPGTPPPAPGGTPR